MRVIQLTMQSRATQFPDILIKRIKNHIMAWFDCFERKKLMKTRFR